MAKQKISKKRSRAMECEWNPIKRIDKKELDRKYDYGMHIKLKERGMR